MKFIILVLFFSNSLFANYKYELLDFYNGKDEIQTPAQLLSHLNMDLSDIFQFNCDSPLRGKLFTLYKSSNLKRSSLKIEDENKVIYTYRHNKLFRNQSSYTLKIEDTFLKTVMSALNSLYKTNTGRQLIEVLQEAPYPLIITNSKRSYFDPKYVTDRYKNLWNEAQFVRMMDTQTPHFFDKIRFKKIGSGGRIHWNHKSKNRSIEVDNIKRVTNSTVVLAHEMYHAYDSVRGLLDTRHIKSDQLESIALLEYRASYLENKIRQELGYKYRKFYSNPPDFDSPGLLDKNQMPIFLKSGCINWL